MVNTNSENTKIISMKLEENRVEFDTVFKTINTSFLEMTSPKDITKELPEMQTTILI